MAIPVNTPKPPVSPQDAADQRLYLRDRELDQGAALIRAAARGLAQLVAQSISGNSRPAPEMEILEEIHDVGPMDVGDLRTKLSSPKQSLARHLNDLEAAGLIARSTDTRDRRRRVVTLTQRGADLIGAATETRREVLRAAFLGTGPEAAAGARRVLQGIISERDRSGV